MSENTSLNLQRDKGNSLGLGGIVKKILFDNMVTILFVVLCIFGIYFSGQSLAFITGELITRIARNAFLVLSLIIPVLAGMGLNFGIVIGAMAGQIAIIAVTHWKITGIAGFLLCILISTPLAILFGYFTGRLLNKTKGQEMIASMILGFFANGLYQLLFLFFIGTIIPMKNPTLVLSGGIGIKNTIDLSGGIKYAVDGLYRMPLSLALLIISLILIVINIYKYLETKKIKRKDNEKYLFSVGASILLLILSIALMVFRTSFMFIKVPFVTILVIVAICIFNVFIVKTKLGQDFRTVGQDMHVANVSGINVDKIRVTAIIISTVLAAWGQLIFLQNIGTLNTYGSHEQVGMFAIAALLIGGASVTKATNSQAIIGIILFHTLFIVSPLAGKNLLGSAQIGEYFRVFVAYGVIGVSLGLHAFKQQIEAKNKFKSQ
ncbi:ABC transporter [Fervidicella metallireducens AeB]|uniref:ABC transporter n=1 Tax=Fervidicella metallireducens AeB TaxID=1403537 RepID=A0A017RW16_9CLOT|nr:ABC transporter permease [Fervidicella metallireducens]EYE88564.1 ABC transporter [Fervidicella metallireducens AeB]